MNTKDIAKLRAQTGAGMLDCKKALEESNGDFDKAVDILKQGEVNEVRIAVPYDSGCDVHDTNVQLLPALEKFGEKYRVEIHEGTISVTPPESKNTHEYWDCGPGLLNSGEHVAVEVKYISFTNE